MRMLTLPDPMPPALAPRFVGAVASRLRELRNAKVGWDEESGSYAVWFFDEERVEILAVTGFDTAALAADGIWDARAEQVLLVVAECGLYRHPEAEA